MVIHGEDRRLIGKRRCPHEDALDLRDDVRHAILEHHQRPMPAHGLRLVHGASGAAHEGGGVLPLLATRDGKRAMRALLGKGARGTGAGTPCQQVRLGHAEHAHGLGHVRPLQLARLAGHGRDASPKGDEAASDILGKLVIGQRKHGRGIVRHAKGRPGSVSHALRSLDAHARHRAIRKRHLDVCRPRHAHPLDSRRLEGYPLACDGAKGNASRNGAVANECGAAGKGTSRLLRHAGQAAHQPDGTRAAPGSRPERLAPSQNERGGPVGPPQASRYVASENSRGRASAFREPGPGGRPIPVGRPRPRAPISPGRTRWRPAASSRKRG